MGVFKAALQDANMSQKELSRRTGVPQPTISEIASGKKLPSAMFTKKTAPHLGIGAGVAYGTEHMFAILRAIEDGDIDKATGADRMIGLVRKLLVHFENVESEEGGESLIDAIEEVLSSLTNAAVDTVRGGKPNAGAATKNAGIHPAFLKSFKHVGTQQADPDEYEVDDGRDALGRRVPKLLPSDYGDEYDSRDLGDDLE